MLIYFRIIRCTSNLFIWIYKKDLVKMCHIFDDSYPCCLRRCQKTFERAQSVMNINWTALSTLWKFTTIITLISVSKLFLKHLLLHNPWTSVLSGHIGFWHFWQVCPHQEFQKMVVISFEHLEKISNFPKLQGWGSKNAPARPISNLK